MDLSPPPLLRPPPGLHHPNNTSFPVIAIAVIGILATAFLLISYYIFVIKCCLTWHRVDIFNRFFSRVRDPSDDLDSSPGNPLAHEAGNTEKGLDEALIRSIPVIEFRKLKKERQFNNNNNNNVNNNTTAAARDHHRAAAVVDEEEQNKQADSYECAVCLSEFEEGERLRVIPYCCHAFHIDCIDVWLQSNANCPLCRSGISPASILYNTHQQHLVSFPPSTPNALSHRNSKDETDNGSDHDNDPLRPRNVIYTLSDDVNESNYDDNDGNEDDDYVVIEIRGNNLDEPRLVRRDASEETKNKGRKKLLKHVHSMGDELIDMRNNKGDDDEFHNVQPIRRSISMDLSTQRDFCVEIQQCYRNNNNNIIIMQQNEQSCSSSSSSSNNNSKVRRSIFSFGYGRSSRCSVQPVHLDP